ncbi:hypothetical protein B0J11DRAFT_421135 [Dendryphion nanum]|uniref:Citrate transporter-like domain-containing protein n=1 Tax=Dendryphion nanum TaxID=256645 RepID=A0A9P9EJ52_9PLEO|nr:hypothetical protein B0J11DRAFT_421135 [Dendryphion nanum]
MAAGSNGDERQSLDTNQIRSWRSILTLIVFVLTNIAVLFPFQIPVFVPRRLVFAFFDSLAALRIVPKRPHPSHDVTSKGLVRMNFPINFLTAPLIADLFLLAILAIGRQEVHDGTIGANNISPIDVMVFFISLAYIAISIDASGLIRWLAYKVLQRGGSAGHRLYFYLYIFFFSLTTFVGNDPVILSGTPFLSYMTRASSNITHPRAWIYSQFAMANIASAILVSSNPTNLVLAGAFQIKFINYTANIIVPVLVTAIVLFPFLLYVVFREDSLIPRSIEMHELPDDIRNREPVNPNIPFAHDALDSYNGNQSREEKENLTSLAEIMNPFLDKKSAVFGSTVMAVTLITVLALNAALSGHTEIHVFWVTLPAAVIMFSWDISYGWIHRATSREIARKGQRNIEKHHPHETVGGKPREQTLPTLHQQSGITSSIEATRDDATLRMDPLPSQTAYTSDKDATDEKNFSELIGQTRHGERQERITPMTLSSIVSNAYQWARMTFPTATTVLEHLPFALVPFAFCMFVLVQALVTKGWVPVFAYGWDHWVNRTGTIGAIGGMAFLSVVLCNFAGTNIGTTILLSRVVQAWQEIHRINGIPISDRTFWATVYSMAIGVNYGAFSWAFSASLAGLLWRDILARKNIHVRSRDFARFNVPIIIISMIVGCVVLVGQIYITRNKLPYNAS